MLFAAYAATLGVHAIGDARYAGPELDHLATAESIAEDSDVEPEAERRRGVGFGLLLAPAHALGGDTGAEVLLAALAALTFAFAVPLARRVVPEPWATRSVLVVGLSPPALAYSANVHPELLAGGLLAAAALLALKVRDTSRLRHAYAAAALLALLPWLGPQYLVPGALVGALLVRWTARRGRGVGALVAAEIVGGSLVVYGTVNEALYGRLVPETSTGAGSVADYLERLPRLASLWVDRDVGLLRWAPFLALAFAGAFLLYRSLADHIARALPDRKDAEAAAAVALAICVGVVLVAVLAAPTTAGEWFAGRHLAAGLPAAAVLAAWGLRRAPRVGAALAALTLAASIWLAIDLRRTGWVEPDSDAPLGPLLEVLPTGEVVPVLIGTTGVLVLAILEWRRVVASASS